MAQSRDQQGTGRHPHKSTDEPWPHTKDEGATQGKSHGGSGGDRSMAAGSQTARMAVPMGARTRRSRTMRNLRSAITTAGRKMT